MADAHEHQDGHAADTGWADQKWFRTAFLAALVIACLGAAALGFLPEYQNPHPHFTGDNAPFETEEFPVFFAIYGFVMFSLIVLVGQHLRKLVARKETYYDERE